VEVVVQHRTEMLQGVSAVDPREPLRQMVGERVRVTPALSLDDRDVARRRGARLDDQRTVVDLASRPAHGLIPRFGLGIDGWRGTGTGGELPTQPAPGLGAPAARLVV